MQRICDSDSPPQIAGLYSIPNETISEFRSAFYLDGISDPGNMGTIFRIAAAFGIECILISPSCCEVASPKVIRSSLGAVYKVPFRTCAATELKAMDTKVIALDMAGKQFLHDYSPDDKPFVMAIGSEAHGLSQDVTAIATLSLRIEMQGDMESLNAAVCAGICAYQISR
jgi:TrmH family RNA methyltransferase